MRCLRITLLAMAAMCGPGVARAAEAWGYDILSLRLAMPASEVLARLAVQGMTGTAVDLAPSGCIAAQADLCAQTIRAHTRDGQLLIQFTRAQSGPERRIAYRIAYAITGRGPADADLLRADAVDRYGEPTSRSTFTWCMRLDLSTDTCPAGQPRLHIEPTRSAAALVTLSDDSIPLK